ncbi:Hypothetical protein POVR2_LOCUS106, partial [uncultured virus]
VLHHLNPSDIQLAELYDATINSDYGLWVDVGKAVRILIKYGLTLTPTKWRALLNKAIKSGYLELVKLSLEYVDPNTKTNQALTLAIDSGGTAILQLVMSDPRVNIDKLDSKLLKSIYYRLVSKSEPMSEGTERVDEPYYRSNLVLTAKDLHHQILRFMTLKKPSRVQLLEYLISLDARELSQAAASVLESTRPYSKRIAAYRALLISLLYPSLTMKDALDSLRAEGYEESSIGLSSQLIKLI